MIPKRIVKWPSVATQAGAEEPRSGTCLLPSPPGMVPAGSTPRARQAAPLPAPGSCRSVQHWVSSGGIVIKRVTKVSEDCHEALPHTRCGIYGSADTHAVNWRKKGTWGQMAQLFDSSLLRALWSRNQTAAWWKLFMNDFWLILVKLVGGGKMRSQHWVWPEALLLTGQTSPVGRGTVAAMLYKDVHVNINRMCWQFPQTDFVRITN